MCVHLKAHETNDSIVYESQMKVLKKITGIEKQTERRQQFNLQNCFPSSFSICDFDFTPTIHSKR